MRCCADADNLEQTAAGDLDQPAEPDDRGRPLASPDQLVGGAASQPEGASRGGQVHYDRQCVDLVLSHDSSLVLPRVGLRAAGRGLVPQVGAGRVLAVTSSCRVVMPQPNISLLVDRVGKAPTELGQGSGHSC